MPAAGSCSLDTQVNLSKSGMTNRLDTIEHHMQLISAQIGPANVSLFSEQPHAHKTLSDSPDPAGAAQPGNAGSVPLTQQLRDMHAELSRMQQAQLSTQNPTPSVASSELARLRSHLEEQSSQVQQLHRVVAEYKQDITILQHSTEAQERAAAGRQRDYQDLVLQVNNVSADMGCHDSDLRDAVSRVEEQQALQHAELSEQLSQHHTDWEKLSSSSILQGEQLKQHTAALAKHEQQLLSSESLGAETQSTLQSVQERVGSAATSSCVTGVFGAVYTNSTFTFPRPSIFISPTSDCCNNSVGML